MDNLTHTLVGVLAARAGLKRLTPRATALSVVAANICDIDIVAATSGINYLNYHRHLTHSFFAVPFLAALAVVLVELPRPWLFRNSPPLRFGRAWAAACLVALSHPLLDATNAYGVRLWLPFSDQWSSWDVFFVVDAGVWAILFLATLLPSLLGLIRGEIGERSDPRWGGAVAGLLVLIAFVGFKGVLHQRAIDMIDAHVYDGSPALRVAAFPTALNPFAWSGFVETESYYHISSVDVRQTYDPESGRRFYKPPAGPAVETAWRSSLGSDYARFAQYAYAEVEQSPEGYIVRLADFRFRRGKQFGFLCTIEMDGAFRVVHQAFRF